MSTFWWLASSMMLAAAVGCYKDAAEDAATQGGTTGASTNSEGNGGAAGTVTGLPCEVQELLQTKCVSCHGVALRGGAPVSLILYDDLTKPSLADPSKSEAQVSLERMQSTTSPMPPSPPGATTTELAAFSSWITAGTPKGSCAPLTGGGGPNPFNTPVVCTSNQKWTRGNRGSSSMHPGLACIDCHSQGEGPLFTFAGTVFPSAHEPNDCVGSSGSTAGLTVVVTDAKGRSVSSAVNSSGNFYETGALTGPFKAKVVNTKTGAERAMSKAVPSGDCNSCHTEAGTEGAPGRIVAP